MKGSSRDYVAVYLEAADAASAPSGWKRYVEFRLGVVSQVGSEGGHRSGSRLLQERQALRLSRLCIRPTDTCRRTGRQVGLANGAARVQLRDE